jgi:ABC-type dipeptide/oligopeptide/nickel transport system permease component
MGVSLPIYFTGLVLNLIFVHKLHWFPVNYTTSRRIRSTGR